MKSQKMCLFDNIFHFYTFDSHYGGVSYAHKTWLLIFFIFDVFANLLYPIKKNAYHDHFSSITVLWKSHKKSATTTLMEMDLAFHSCCYFSSDWLFLESKAVPIGAHPQTKNWLGCLSLGVEKQLSRNLGSLFFERIPCHHCYFQWGFFLTETHVTSAD